MSQFGSKTVILWVLLLAATACSEPEDPERSSEFITRDSSGVQIAENELSPRPAQCSMSDAPDMSLGTQFGDPEFELHRVVGAVTLSDGLVAVANRGGFDVRVYGDDGDGDARLVTAFGREGSGPGEFRNMFGLLRRAGDTLVVLDSPPWRYQEFDRAGDLVRSVVPDPPYVNLPPGGGVGILPDGSTIIGSRCCVVADPEFQQMHLFLSHHDRAGVLVDTVAVSPDGMWGPIGPPGQPPYYSYRGFEAFTSWDVKSDSVVMGVGSAPAFQVLTKDGQQRRSIRWNDRPREVTTAHVDEYRRRQVDREMEDYALPPMRSDLPFFDQSLVSQDGRFWVRRYDWGEQPSRTWLAFDGSGEFWCRLSVPAGLQVFEVGENHLLGREVDELGVEYVRRYLVSPP